MRISEKRFLKMQTIVKDLSISWGFRLMERKCLSVLKQRPNTTTGCTERQKILQKQEGIPEKEITSIFRVCIRFILNMVQKANEGIILLISDTPKKNMVRMKKFGMI